MKIAARKTILRGCRKNQVYALDHELQILCDEFCKAFNSSAFSKTNLCLG